MELAQHRGVAPPEAVANPKEEHMKKQLVVALCGSLMLAGAGIVGAAETVRKETTTEKTTTFKGTVSEFGPGSSTIVLKSEAGMPSRYTINEKTTFVDQNGNVVSRETIKDQPVTIYTPEAGSTTVSKIVVDRSAGGGETMRRERTVEERRVE